MITYVAGMFTGDVNLQNNTFIGNIQMAGLPAAGTLEATVLHRSARSDPQTLARFDAEGEANNLALFASCGTSETKPGSFPSSFALLKGAGSASARFTIPSLGQPA